jgi:hypothetical protein
VKSKKQIEGMRAVGKIAREILDIGAAAVRPGTTTDEIDRIVHEATIARNAYPSPLNYKKFPKVKNALFSLVHLTNWFFYLTYLLLSFSSFPVLLYFSQ